MNRFILAAALSLAVGPIVRAQSTQHDAFSSLTIRAGVTRFRGDSRFARYYSPETGFVLEASTPFEFGELALTGERATFTSVGGVNPAFHGTLAPSADRAAVSESAEQARTLSSVRRAMEPALAPDGVAGAAAVVTSRRGPGSRVVRGHSAV